MRYWQSMAIAVFIAAELKFSHLRSFATASTKLSIATRARFVSIKIYRQRENDINYLFWRLAPFTGSWSIRTKKTARTNFASADGINKSLSLATVRVCRLHANVTSSNRLVCLVVTSPLHTPGSKVHHADRATSGSNAVHYRSHDELTPTVFWQVIRAPSCDGRIDHLLICFVPRYRVRGCSWQLVWKQSISWHSFMPRLCNWHDS